MKRKQITAAVMAMLMVFALAGCSGDKTASRSAAPDSRSLSAERNSRYYASADGRVAGTKMPESPKTAMQDAKRTVTRAGEKMEDAAEKAGEKLRQAGKEMTGK